MGVTLEKLTSRKFWVLIAYGVITLVGDELGLDVDAERVEFLTYAVLGYFGFQGAIDFIKAKT